MARKVLGQEVIFGQAGMKNDLDALHGVIDWCPVEDRLSGIYASLRGQTSWPPISLFKALLLSIWAVKHLV